MFTQEFIPVFIFFFKYKSWYMLLIVSGIAQKKCDSDQILMIIDAAP